jgi:serine/threonine protein kinase
MVYRGHQAAFRRDVAVKVIQRSGLDEDDRRRFDRECQAMGALSNHPGIVTLFDAGFTADGRPYLVMAYARDGTLHDRVAADGAMGWQEVSRMGVRLSGALEAAHRAGVLHRDVKPANVLLSEYGEQLSDFGISRIQGGHETRSGVITASVAYAAPEILEGAPPSVRADVYGLASTLFEALYGRAAFAGDEDEGWTPVAWRVATEPPPDLREHGVPDAVATVIEKAMAKDPSHRYATAEEFGVALRATQTALGVDATDLAVLDAGPTAVHPAGSDSATVVDSGWQPATRAGHRPQRRGSGRSRWWFAAAAGVVAAVIAVLAVPPLLDDGGGDESIDEPSTLPDDSSVDAGADEPASLPDSSLPDAPAPSETIVMEAEDQSLTPPMSARTDTQASGAAFVSSDEPNAGVVRFDFEVEQGGRYWVWARFASADPPLDHNSLAVSLDNEETDVWDFFESEDPPGAGWHWERISLRCGGGADNHLCDPWRPNIDPGPHALVISGRETLSALDQIVITNDPGDP